MSAWYIDTSAALKLVLREPESIPLIEAINTEKPDLVAGYLLETQMRRVVHRTAALTQSQVTDVLDRVSLVELRPSTFMQAGLLPGTYLRSLDALHLAVAIESGAELVVSYDTRMIAAARELGLEVASPGRPPGDQDSRTEGGAV